MTPNLITHTGRLLLLLAMLVPGFSACLPSQTPVAVPTPAALTVQVTPALQSLRDIFHDCTAELNNTGLILLDTPTSALDPAQADLALRWGLHSSPTGFTAITGQEELLLITHPQNPLHNLALADLQAIYLGKQRTWADGRSIQVWAYPTGEDIQQNLEAVILNGSPMPANLASTAPDPAAMLEAIADSPLAIGFIPARWLNDSVRALTVDGLSAAQMRQPVLVISQSEPDGQEKAWLLCLQAHLSE